MIPSELDNARLEVLVHEVRSPVAALSAVAETFGESGANDEARRELARLAVAACRAIERLLMDVAVASVRIERVEVDALVRDVVAAHVLRRSDVVVDTDDRGLVVEADPVRLRQALDNLVTNALAYGASGHVAVRVTRSGDEVRIAVSDHGPGIPPEVVEQIFELGRRLSTDRPGSGIGLALTRAIVGTHGGTIAVESTPEAGSTFTIVLPALGSA